jgi:hypothetical protein
MENLGTGSVQTDPLPRLLHYYAPGETAWYKIHAVFGLKKEILKQEGSFLEESCSGALGFRAGIGWP